MIDLLDRLCTPTTPGALLGAVHPDLGLGLRGCRPTGTVVRYVSHPEGEAVVIAVPTRLVSNGPNPAVGEMLSVALAVDGVLHAGSYRVLSVERDGSGAIAGSVRSRRLGAVIGSALGPGRAVTLLVPSGADDVVSRRLSEPALLGHRVWLDTSPGYTGIDLRDRAHDADTSPGDEAERRVRFSVDGLVASAGPQDRLLDVAHAAGLEPPTGCRRGVCHRCATRLRSGETVNTRDATLGRAGDLVRICVSTARTDVELEL